MSEAATWKALRDLQRAVRAYTLGICDEAKGWQRIMDAERAARELITRADTPEPVTAQAGVVGAEPDRDDTHTMGHDEMIAP